MKFFTIKPNASAFGTHTQPPTEGDLRGCVPWTFGDFKEFVRGPGSRGLPDDAQLKLTDDNMVLAVLAA